MIIKSPMSFSFAGLKLPAASCGNVLPDGSASQRRKEVCHFSIEAWARVLPDGSASQPGKEKIRFYIARLDPAINDGGSACGSASRGGEQTGRSLTPPPAKHRRQAEPTGNALAIAVQFEVPWGRYNAQLLYPPLSCHHEPALKGLLRNWKTRGRPQTPLHPEDLQGQLPPNKTLAFLKNVV